MTSLHPHPPGLHSSNDMEMDDFDLDLNVVGTPMMQDAMDMPDDIPEGMPEEMPEDMPEDIPEDMPEDIPEDMPEDMQFLDTDLPDAHNYDNLPPGSPHSIAMDNGDADGNIDAQQSEEAIAFDVDADATQDDAEGAIEYEHDVVPDSQAPSVDPLNISKTSDVQNEATTEAATLANENLVPHDHENDQEYLGNARPSESTRTTGEANSTDVHGNGSNEELNATTGDVLPGPSRAVDASHTPAEQQPSQLDSQSDSVPQLQPVQTRGTDAIEATSTTVPAVPHNETRVSPKAFSPLEATQAHADSDTTSNHADGQSLDIVNTDQSPDVPASQSELTTELSKMQSTVIHPILVAWEDQKDWLFRPRSADEYQGFYLEDSALLHQSYTDLFHALRKALDDAVSDSEELELDLPTFDTVIREYSCQDNSTLAEFVTVYVRLEQLDGNNTPEPFEIILRRRARFTTRLAQLKEAVDRGQGLSQLDFLQNATHADSSEYYVDEEEEESHQSGEEEEDGSHKDETEPDQTASQSAENLNGPNDAIPVSAADGVFEASAEQADQHHQKEHRDTHNPAPGSIEEGHQLDDDNFVTNVFLQNDETQQQGSESGLRAADEEVVLTEPHVLSATEDTEEQHFEREVDAHEAHEINESAPFLEKVGDAASLESNVHGAAYEDGYENYETDGEAEAEAITALGNDPEGRDQTQDISAQDDEPEKGTAVAKQTIDTAAKEISYEHDEAQLLADDDLIDYDDEDEAEGVEEQSASATGNDNLSTSMPLPTQGGSPSSKRSRESYEDAAENTSEFKKRKSG